MGSYYDAMHLMQLNHKFHFSPSMIALIMVCFIDVFVSGVLANHKCIVHANESSSS